MGGSVDKCGDSLPILGDIREVGGINLRGGNAELRAACLQDFGGSCGADAVLVGAIAEERDHIGGASEPAGEGEVEQVAIVVRRVDQIIRGMQHRGAVQRWLVAHDPPFLAIEIQFLELCPPADRRCRLEVSAIEPDTDMSRTSVGIIAPTALLKLVNGMIDQPQKPPSRRPDAAGAIREQDITITERSGVEM